MAKCDTSINQDTRDAALDKNKYKSGDDLPYTLQ